jgi:hypothetical protein
MSPRAREVLGVLTGVASVALITHVALATDWRALSPFERVQAELNHRPAPPPEPAAPATRVPCFGCHAEARFEAHAPHSDAGHCHTCHAFEGHARALLREEPCGACHP